MSFEKKISDLNENYFFKEFTYTKNKFISPKLLEQEVEVADNIISLDDITIIYQIKERIINKPSTRENEEKWFHNKVIVKAIRQIRTTLEYLATCETVLLTNQRGHSFNLATKSIQKIHKIVLHKNDSLPVNCKNIKFHLSKTAKIIIHILPAEDYLGVVQNLITPAEVSEYFSFREVLIQKWQGIINDVCEQALVGQFMSGKWEDQPDNKFVEYLAAIDHKLQAWDMVGIIRSFQEKITEIHESIDYYLILKEMAKLRRYELGMFKERYIAALEACKSSKFELPYRMVVPRLACGFLFIPCWKEDRDYMRNGLLNLTLAHKYDQKLTRCVGVIMVLKKGKKYFLEWCYFNFPWKEDIELDKNLKDNFPFREVRLVEVERYEFKERLS